MKNLQTIKAEKEAKLTALMEECGVFFAFSNEQFQEGKTPLSEGDKYLSIGAGGYMHKSKLSVWKSGIPEIENWFKSEIESNKARRAYIIYELANHEAWYTYELDDTLAALGSDYTEEEVREVFNSERANQLMED